MRAIPWRGFTRDASAAARDDASVRQGAGIDKSSRSVQDVYNII